MQRSRFVDALHCDTIHTLLRVPHNFFWVVRATRSRWDKKELGSIDDKQYFLLKTFFQPSLKHQHASQMILPAMITAQASSLGHLHQAFSLDQTLSFYAHEQESCLANLMAWWWRLMVQKIVSRSGKASPQSFCECGDNHIVDRRPRPVAPWNQG